MGKSQTQYRNNTQCQIMVGNIKAPINITSLISLLLLIFVVLTVFLSNAAFSDSQVSVSPNRIVPIPHPIISLLRAKEVQHELGLSAAQIDNVEEVIDDIDLPLWHLRDLPLQERNNSAGILIQQLKQNLASLLSSRQMERLKQLSRQAEGIATILEPEVAVRLGLSDEQIDNIRILLNTSYNKLIAVHRNVEIRSESQKAARIRKLREETEKNVFAVLNSSQQRTLRKLTGQLFDLSQVRIIACKAPEFNVDAWINSPGVTLSDLEGKVTVVHFYAFGCGNCIRTLPCYNEWRAHFPSDAFQIIGIHRSETKRERDIDLVKEKAAEAGIEYPIAIDNDSLMWDAWANRVWPSIYLLDKKGYVRLWWYGELNWKGAESEKYLRSKIQELIAETSVLNTKYAVSGSAVNNP